MSDVIEEWKPVVGWESVYEVSTQGRIRRVKQTSQGRDGYVLKPVVRKGDGYVVAGLCDGGREKQYLLHEIVSRAFHGPRPLNHVINHIDAVRTNCSAANLEYVTPKQNNAHMVRLGRSLRGEKNPQAKLTEAQVREIRSMQGKMKGTQIAAMYGVSKDEIYLILRNKKWKHVS